MLKVIVHRSISDIDSKTWESINVEDDCFKSFDFLKRVENSNIEKSEYWYLLVYKEDRIIGATVLSSFYISLDLFLDDFGKWLIRNIRRILPGFFRIKFLFCGIPISIGKNTILIKEKPQTEEVVEEIVQQMQKIGKENKIYFLNIKEFYLENDYKLKISTKFGFFQTWSLPYMTMDIKWSGFNDYLESLRHNYRRQILKQMPKVDFSAIGMSDNSDNKDIAVLKIGIHENINSNLLYEQYLQVMNRAESVLEVLPVEFFTNLVKKNDKVEIVSISKNEKVLGTAILIKESSRLVFLLVGLDYKYRDSYAVYFNLIYGIIGYAIKNKFKAIDMGQTSYYVKARVGATGKPMITYIKSTKKGINFILRVFNKIIFPETKLPAHHVFKKSV